MADEEGFESGQEGLARLAQGRQLPADLGECLGPSVCLERAEYISLDFEQQEPPSDTITKGVPADGSTSTTAISLFPKSCLI
jgi:hypothetical protein